MADAPHAPLPIARLDERAVAAALRRLAMAPSGPWLHAEVARRMAERLPIIRKQPATVLEWWAFGGASDEVLREACPKARRLRIEPSAALLQRSLQESQAAWWSARRWAGPPLQAVAEDAVPAGCGELLWANMMLHAVADPTPTLHRWQQALAVDGFVMFSCLGPDSARELRELYAALGWPPAGNQFIDMHDIGDMLVHAGFADPVMDQEHLVLTWPDPDALLAELRSLGGNASPSRTAGLRTPRWRERLSAALRTLSRPGGRLALSFEVIYGHAFKPAPRPRIAGETAVSLDEMRSMVRSPRARG